MSIAIEPSDELEQLRTRLRKMSDDALVNFGTAAKSLCRDPLKANDAHLQFETVGVLDHGAYDSILDLPVVQVDADLVAYLELPIVWLLCG